MALREALDRRDAAFQRYLDRGYGAPALTLPIGADDAPTRDGRPQPQRQPRGERCASWRRG